MEEAKEKSITYELAYLLRLGETETSIEASLQDAGAAITLKGPVNQIQLAYPIKKQASALFGFFQFQLPAGEAVKTISKALQLKDGVLRFLFVKLPKQKPAPLERKSPAAAPVPEKKTPIIPAVTSIDSLSNEKLEETLEEILK